LPTKTKPVVIWQSETESDEGLELKITKFDITKDCKDCYSFSGQLIGPFDDYDPTVILVRGNIKNNQLLSYELKSESDEN